MIGEAARDNLLKKMGKAGLERIEKARIGLAGAGGLGSNCAACLVRAGFRKFTIVDFDIVDASNLDRQFYFADQVGMDKVEALKINLLRINPLLEVRMIKERVEKTNIAAMFDECGIIVECFDRAEYKRMFAAELLSSGKFLVSASGLGGAGSSDDIKVHKIKDNFILVGDLHSDIDTTPALSPRVTIAAAKQADVVLDHVLNQS